MKREKYVSVEEWMVDLERVRAHPNDKHLLASVVRLIENSSEQIKKEIKDYLSNSALEINPWTVFDQISKENPNHILFVKTRKDPWFTA